MLKAIVVQLCVEDLPELIVRYLAGDKCLDKPTVESVFHKKYRNMFGHTFLDEDCTVPHSFEDAPTKYGTATDVPYPMLPATISEWYFNGVRHRENGFAFRRVYSSLHYEGGTPVYERKILKIWIQLGKIQAVKINDRDCTYDLVNNGLRIFNCKDAMLFQHL
jgi:hypothetical protein